MRIGIGWSLAAGLVMSAVFTASPASADNEFLDSDPRPGVTLELEPSRVTIAFNDDVTAKSTTIVVRNSSGKIITSRDQHVEANNIYANLPYPLPAGLYRVDYRALDGKVPFGGSFEFAWKSDAEAVGLSQWRKASNIPKVLALPGDDELRAAESADTSTNSPSPSPSSSKLDTAAGSSKSESNSGLDWWWIPPGILLIGGLGSLAIVAARRRHASVEVE